MCFTRSTLPVAPDSRRIVRPMSIHGIMCAVLVTIVAAPPISIQAADTPTPEQIAASVDSGLRYLASMQANDGSFPGSYGKAPGVVSLCGMAFLAAGHTPGRGPYGDEILRCIEFDLSRQTEAGYIAAIGGSPDRGMYSHNIATLFLLEVSGMVNPALQARVDPAISKALELTLTAQAVRKAEQHAGGWRYNQNSGDSDLSCSGWALMALRSARLNGAMVPDEAIERATDYIMSKRDLKNGGFGYQSASASTSLTGAGLLCLELTGHHGDKITFQAGDHILRSMRELEKHSHYEYGVYYSAQGMFQLGGRHWERYASWLYSYWYPLQKNDGSWHAVPGSWIAGSGGHTYSYTTAMMLLSFTVPYRQLPIYQRDETVDEEE